jgi:hypothetical protein
MSATVEEPAVMSTSWTERAMLKQGLVERMAWRRYYLTATRARSSAAYTSVEEAAWQRLQRDLATFGSPASNGQTNGDSPAHRESPV